MQAHTLNLSSEAFCQSKPTAKKEERKKIPTHPLYSLTQFPIKGNSFRAFLSLLIMSWNSGEPLIPQCSGVLQVVQAVSKRAELCTEWYTYCTLVFTFGGWALPRPREAGHIQPCLLNSCTASLQGQAAAASLLWNEGMALLMATALTQHVQLSRGVLGSNTNLLLRVREYLKSVLSASKEYILNGSN